ncbi:hypothetical protein ACFL2J_02010 [Candidatus Omnitrophota bacterium]
MPIYNLQEINSPSLNEEASVELGDTIVSKGKIYTVTYKAMILSNEVHSKDKEVVVIGSSVSVPPGELIAKVENSEWTYFSSKEGVIISRWGAKLMNEGGLRLSKIDGHIEILAPQWSWLYSKVPHVEPIFEVKNIQVAEKSRPSFKQELIYNGKVGSSVKFLYRELSDDMLRPAFSQEIQYDLNESKTIGFKGVRVEIIEATNTNLRYKVLKSFPDTP